jgi:hypothetical protein
LARTFNRSRVERARRSNRATITVSPCATMFSFASSGRSARAPLTFSRKDLGAPGRFQVPKLRIQRLPIRTDSGVPVDGHCDLPFAHMFCTM